MPIRHPRSLRALAVQERSLAVDAVDLAAGALAAIEAEISAVRREMDDLAAPDQAPSMAGSRAALLEAAALDRAARNEKSRGLAQRLNRLESDRAAAVRDLDGKKEALALAIRKAERLTPS